MSVGLPSHYQLRLEHMSHEVSRLPRDASGTVILLGDAHVEDNDVKEFSGAHVINMGIKEDELGKDCGGIKDRLWLLPMARPAHVIIIAGLNDIKAGRNPLEIEKCFHELIQAVRRTAPAAKIHVAMIPPTRDRFEKLMHNIALMNAILEELCVQEGVECVDLFSNLEDDEGLLCEDCTTDGFYLNDTGYDKMNAMLERHLESGEEY
jgi:lysophospholipase L1-like esterase